MRSILTAASLAFALVSLALAACGDDTDPGGASSTSTTDAGSTGTTGGGTTSSMSGTGGGTGGEGGAGGAGGAGGSADIDIFEKLKTIPGVQSVEEGASTIDGYRFFTIEFDQPVDHKNPNGQHFTQRLALHHKDKAAPFVLATTGYYLWLPYQYLEEPAELLGGNQLIIEHRYFSPSRPNPADWTLLNIEQAAADHHEIAEAFHPIYTGKWISTGVSKGGMTSVYHRRFYPGDVDGTVAYVAPHSASLEDPRYVTFLNEVGDAVCRDALKDFQREALIRRDAMLSRMADQAAVYQVTFDLLGIDPSLESTVISLPFAFWQYNGADRCKDIPLKTATDDEIWAFLDEIGLPLYSADPYLLGFEPYYWQAYSQLGTPGIDTSHLQDLLIYDWDTIDDLPSIDLEPVYDPAPMQDITAWLTTQGERILFIYGETDPWSAGAFDPGGAKETYRFFVPAGNHGSKIIGLPMAERQVALGALEAWTGVAPNVQPKVMPPKPLPPPFRVVRRGIGLH